MNDIPCVDSCLLRLGFLCLMCNASFMLLCPPPKKKKKKKKKKKHLRLSICFCEVQARLKLQKPWSLTFLKQAPWPTSRVNMLIEIDELTLLAIHCMQSSFAGKKTRKFWSKRLRV